MGKKLDLTGGESVYCINQFQLEEAFKLANEDPESSPRIHEWLGRLEEGLNRNEQAALAFVIIDRLLKSAHSPPPKPAQNPLT